MTILDMLEDVDDVEALTETGANIRAMVMEASLPDDLRASIAQHWEATCAGQEVAFAVGELPPHGVGHQRSDSKREHDGRHIEAIFVF